MEIVARALNVSIMPAPSNEPALRQDAVRWYLGAPIDANTPRLLVSSCCETTIGGFRGALQADQAGHRRRDRQAGRGEETNIPHPRRLAVPRSRASRPRAGAITDAAQMGRPGKVRADLVAPARADFNVFDV